jgi:RNA recognition motif-containing protein
MRQRRGSNNKSSMGCGIVEFATEDDAVNAVSTLNETELKGRIIHCREDRDPSSEPEDDVSATDNAVDTTGPVAGGKSKGPRRLVAKSIGDDSTKDVTAAVSNTPKVADPLKIFISGLDWGVNSDDLKEHFSSQGIVANAEVMTNRKGRSMGAGIVEFSDIAAVHAAVVNCNQSEIKGRKIGVRQYYQ